MQVENILKHKVVEGLNVLNHDFGNGYLNGLLVTLYNKNPILEQKTPDFPNGYITVKRRTDNGVRVLASRIPLHYFRDLTQFTFGAVDDAHISTLVIPLGSIYLNGSSELEIEMEFTASTSNGFDSANDDTFVNTFYVSVATYQGEKATDFMLQYDTSRDLEQKMANVHSLYLGNSNSSNDQNAENVLKLESLSANFKLEMNNDKDVFFSIHDALSVTNVFTNAIEYSTGNNSNTTYADASIVQLYENETNLPKAMYLRCYDIDFNSGLELFIIRRIYDSKEVSKNVVREMEKEVQEVKEIEREDPETAKALRHSGLAEKAEDIDELKKEVEKNEEIEKELKK